MRLFKKDGMKPEEPDNQTPATPAEPAPAEPPPETVPKEDFDALKESHDKLADQIKEVNLRLQNYGQPDPTPAQPPGPSETDKLKTEIESLNAQITKKATEIDEAYNAAQPIGKLMSEKDELIAKRSDLRAELRLRPQIDQLQASGTAALDQLSETVTSGQMPLLSNANVKRTYDEFMKTLAPEQRMNPQTRIQVYKYSIGVNHEEIVNLRLEEEVRKAAEPTTTQEPGTTTGRETATATSGAVPKPEEVLDPENLQAIRFAGKTVDQYYQSLGYANWEDYYEKVGKDYFEGEEVA